MPASRADTGCMGIITKLRTGPSAAETTGYGGSRGFTIIEVMIAALLLLVAMAGFLPFFLSGLTQASSVRYKSLATNIAREHMEKVRRLDYREIGTPEELAERFGDTTSVGSEGRIITFDIDYDVEVTPYDLGTLKQVTVNVSWERDPVGSTASITTMVHQQFLGPRGAYLELIPLLSDPLGTPFPRIDGQITARYHIASADWGLVLDNLDQPGMSARDVYMRLSFFDNDRQSFPDEDIQITDLYYSTDAAGKVNDVYFQYQFNSASIPDGYWEMRTVAYNEYNEPGNVWRLRVRVEDGPPGVPLMFEATPGPDDQSMELTWTGAAEQERDRAYYVLERRTWDRVAGVWPSTWTPLAPGLDPKSTSYLDQGELFVADPWGDPTTQNVYQYRLWAVDICQPGLVGPAVQAEAAIPPSVTTTTLVATTTTIVIPTTSTTSTTIGLSTGQVVNQSNKSYTVTVKNASGTTVVTKSVSKNSTVTITGLAAGEYLITATTPGRPTLTQSFSMPEMNGAVLMTIF